MSLALKRKHIIGIKKSQQKFIHSFFTQYVTSLQILKFEIRIDFSLDKVIYTTRDIETKFHCFPIKNQVFIFTFPVFPFPLPNLNV